MQRPTLTLAAGLVALLATATPATAMAILAAPAQNIGPGPDSFDSAELDGYSKNRLPNGLYDKQTHDMPMTGGELLDARYGSFSYGSLNPGTDVGDFTTAADTLQRMKVDRWPLLGVMDTRLALERSLAVTPPVPEPQTYALMLAGLGVMLLLGRTRRRE